MTLRLVRAALVVKVQGNTAVWPRATWILPELTDTSRGHTRPGKRRTHSSKHWRWPHTLAGHNCTLLHQAKRSYIPSSQITLLSCRPFLQTNVDMWPFKWGHSSFRASENSCNFFCNRQRAIRTTKLCLREWDMDSNPSILMILNIMEREKEAAILTKKHSSPPTSMSHKVQQDQKHFSSIFNLKG